MYIAGIEAERDVLAAKISAQQQRFNITIGFIFIVILGVTLTLTLLISNRIAKSIRKTATQMHEASAQVASAARQVSAQSQALAQSAGEHAAKIQETASSLE